MGKLKYFIKWPPRLTVRYEAEYGSFIDAKKRCTNLNHPRYSDYIGRGIKFLFASFEEFFTELGPKPEPKSLYVLDRYPNNDGHYEKGNVRWATYSESNFNKRQDTVAQKKNMSRAGRLGARKRNSIYGNPATPESCSKAGHISGHLRWHISRGIVNPNCDLCQGSL